MSKLLEKLLEFVIIVPLAVGLSLLVAPLFLSDKAECWCCVQDCCPLDCKDSETCKGYCCDGTSKHDCQSPCCNGERK